MQLPVQTALTENIQTGAEDDGEPLLMAMEAQEDLGSGEDLLSATDPQPKPAVCEEVAPETAATALAEEEAAPSAVVSAEAPPVVLVEEVPAAESVQAEAPTVTEEVAPAADAELAPSEPAAVLGVAEAVEPPAAVAQETPAEAPAEAPTEAAAGAPPEEAPPAEVLTHNSAPGAALENLAEVLENKPNESSTPGEVPAQNVVLEPAELSVPADGEPIVDADIAAATVPEVPSPLVVSPGAQVELQPSTEGGKASTPTDETEETPLPEPDAVEQCQNPEASRVSETLPEEGAAPSVISEAGTDGENVSVIELTPTQSEGLPSPASAADPDQEASTDGMEF